MKKVVDWHAPKKKPCRADGLCSLSVYIEREYKDKFDNSKIKHGKKDSPLTSKTMLEMMIKKFN